MTNAIELREVYKSFGNTPVLNGINLSVAPGTVVCLAGRSGSGKTTLLRCINRLERIDSGQILHGGELIGVDVKSERPRELNHRQISKQRQRIGMVFQHFNLFPHMTALENVSVGPMRVLGRSKAESVKDALELLARVGLSGKAKSYPSQLSGGQQQRVAIARALSMRPDAMLFDEPTSALDPELTGEVLSVMRDLAQQGMTMIVSTHELGFARDVGDLFVFMNNGVIVETGIPNEVLANPQHTETKVFLKNVGFK